MKIVSNIELNPEKLFSQQASALKKLKKSSFSERARKLKSIKQFLNDRNNEKALQEALYADLRKSHAETLSTEIGPVLLSLRHILRHLPEWMRVQRVPTPLAMIGTSSRILHEPKGRCLIISPWNYPFQLCLNPALYAIAAGNAIILKPSEMSPHTSAFIQNMMAELFPSEEVAVVQGGVEVSQALLALPFDHIFFTGSPQVGKIVMSAAAQHLSSVTLELGGKSPAIIDQSVNVRKAARKTAWAKTLNCGQTCIAPDYLLIHSSKKAAFVEHFQASIAQFYNPEQKGIQASPDYGRIINARHFQRLEKLLQDAQDKGAQILCGGESDPQDLFLAPTLVDGLSEDMTLLQEEIFGPILPILTFDHIEEMPEILQRRPKPLSFYIQSKSKKNQRFLLENSSSGGAVLNDYLLGSLNPYLPFGGVNHSGIGKSNGHHSFVEFSNERGIVRRDWGHINFVQPPFSRRLNSLLRILFNKI